MSEYVYLGEDNQSNLLELQLRNIAKDIKLLFVEMIVNFSNKELADELGISIEKADKAKTVFIKRITEMTDFNAIRKVKGIIENNSI